MSEKKYALRKGMLLVAFGVILYSVLQNLDSVIGGILHVLGILSPVILGLCIAFVLNVLMSACERIILRVMKRFKCSLKPAIVRGTSLILTLLLAIGLITLTLVVISPRLTDAVTLVLSELPQSTKELSAMTGNLMTRVGFTADSIAGMQASIGELGEKIRNLLSSEGANIAGFALNMTSSLLGTVTDILFALIIAIYVLLDKERISRFVHALLKRFLPERYCREVVRLSKLSNTTFTAFVRGQFLEAIILGVLCFIGMLVFRFPHADVISLLIGVTALIPIVGAWIGGAISALLVLLVSPVKALLLIVFILVLQQLEGNLIYPKVVGSSIGLPGVLVLTAVILGQGLMGVVGILIAVPLTAVVFTVLKEMISVPHKAEEK